MKIILTVLFALGIIAAIASSNNSSTEKPTSSVSCEKEVDNITDSQSNEPKQKLKILLPAIGRLPLKLTGRFTIS